MKTEHTATPWKFTNRNWRNEVDPAGSLYVTGDHGVDDDYGPYCTAVCVVVGNSTAGAIPLRNAELIVRAVNAHDVLLAACKAVLEDCGSRLDNQTHAMLCGAIEVAEAKP